MTFDRRVVLVSGMPRSGTTTVGDVLDTAAGTVALYEPMNFHSGDKIITRYFEIPGTAAFSNDLFADLVARISCFQLHLKSGVWPEDQGLRRIAKYLVGGRSRVSLRKAKLARNIDTVIWKDPIAGFAMRRFVEQGYGPAVITLRSPHAVAASFKRMKWGFKLDDIFPRLEELGVPTPEGWHEADISDSVTNAALLWSALYGDELALAREHPDLVTVVDLDDVIRDPFGTYKTLFNKLSLSWTEKTQSHLEATYAAKETSCKDIPTGHAHSKKRDVSQANQYWRKVLTEEEVAIVDRWTVQ